MALNTASCQQWKLEAVSSTAKSSLNAQNSEALLEDQTQVSDLMLFPNPANDQVEILFPQNDSIPVSILITDMIGNSQISKKDVTGGKTAVDISKLKAGIYIVSVKNGATITNKKLVVKR